MPVVSVGGQRTLCHRLRLSIPFFGPLSIISQHCLGHPYSQHTLLATGMFRYSNIRYYICSTYICGFAAMAYFAMLSGQGWTAIAGCRQFFYARCDGSMPLRQLYLRQNYVVVACRQTYVVLLKRRWNDVGMLTWVS